MKVKATKKPASKQQPPANTEIRAKENVTEVNPVCTGVERKSARIRAAGYTCVKKNIGEENSTDEDSDCERDNSGGQQQTKPVVAKTTQKANEKGKRVKSLATLISKFRRNHAITFLS